MHEKKADYTNTFCNLMDLEPDENHLYNEKSFLDWKVRWKNRISKGNYSPEKCKKLMRDNNPLVIPRNHKIEDALEAAENNNLKPIKKILEILQKPYTEQMEIRDFQLPSKSNKEYQTYCGT